MTLTAAGCLLAGCSDQDDYDYSPGMGQNDVAILPPGVFDGEWTVNRQVVDTARLTVGSSLRVRLPEAYLTELCFPGEAPEAIVDNEPQSYILQQQGYSEQSQFMTLVTPTVALAALARSFLQASRTLATTPLMARSSSLRRFFCLYPL